MCGTPLPALIYRIVNLITNIFEPGLYAGGKCCLSWSWQSIIRAHGRLFRKVPTWTGDSFPNAPTWARDSFSRAQYYILGRLTVKLIINIPLLLLAMYSRIQSDASHFAMIARMGPKQNLACHAISLSCKARNSACPLARDKWIFRRTTRLLIFVVRRTFGEAGLTLNIAIKVVLLGQTKIIVCFLLRAGKK